jgi:hypothetical protein
VDRPSLSPQTVVLAVLCLAVIAFAAATVDSTTDPEGDIGAGSPGLDDRPGDVGTPVGEDSGQSERGDDLLDLDLRGVPFQVCVVWLTRPLVQSLLLLGVLGIFVAGWWYDDAVFGLGLVVPVAYLGSLLYLFLTSCATGDFGIGVDLSRAGAPSLKEGGGIAGGAPAAPSVLTQLLFLLVVGLLGVVAVLVLTGDHDRLSDESEADPVDEPVEERADVAAVGAAAGRAADRLERDGDFENEVFRAWAEMTDPLTVEHPDASTPAEFARVAVRAGMDPADVDELTALFEEVRYGGADPTPEREHQAVETLRRIEATYAEDGGEPG